MKLIRTLGSALILVGACSLGGCAAMRAAGAKHEYIEQKVQSHTYDKPLSVVWPQARQLLFSEGFEVKDTDASNAETEWKYEGSYRKRYLVSGIAVGKNKCQVQFTKSESQKKSGGGWYDPDTARDLGLEWDLLKKVSPDRASKIEAEAEARGEKAK